MAVGNQVGGVLADRHRFRGLILGYVGTAAFSVLIATGGANLLVLCIGLFGVGAMAMMAIPPTVQVLLTDYGPEAPTLMGVAEPGGAQPRERSRGGNRWCSDSGRRLRRLSTAWVGGVLLIAVALVLFAFTVPRFAPPAPVANPSSVTIS